MEEADISKYRSLVITLIDYKKEEAFGSIITRKRML
jgi:hypothetical protein